MHLGQYAQHQVEKKVWEVFLRRESYGVGLECIRGREHEGLLSKTDGVCECIHS